MTWTENTHGVYDAERREDKEGRALCMCKPASQISLSRSGVWEAEPVSLTSHQQAGFTRYSNATPRNAPHRSARWPFFLEGTSWWHRRRSSMATARMKLVFLWLCIVHMVLTNARLFTRNDLQAAHRALSENRGQSTQSAGGWIISGPVASALCRGHIVLDHMITNTEWTLDSLLSTHMCIMQSFIKLKLLYT